MTRLRILSDDDFDKLYKIPTISNACSGLIKRNLPLTGCASKIKATLFFCASQKHNACALLAVSRRLSFLGQ